MEKMENSTKTPKAKGYKVIGMTNSIEEIQNHKKKYGLTFEYYTCDAIVLKKTIERANPSIVVLIKVPSNKSTSQ
jgi:hypothetical protein